MSETITQSGARAESRRWIWAAAVTVLVLGFAVTAGLLSSPDGGTPVIFVERISSAISGLTSGAGSGLWWMYAFFLGIVAAFNPCGFALLPAYLGLYLNDERAERSYATRTRRSLAVSAVVALAFTLSLWRDRRSLLFGFVSHPSSIAVAGVRCRGPPDHRRRREHRR
jgi:cytochrome c biogenesis protein CcdA